MGEKSYAGDCLRHARSIAQLLRDAGREPSIAVIRKSEERPRGRFHFPLMPLRFGGAVTWTTHYVCVCDGLAYDPIIGQPVPLDGYMTRVFGEEFPITFSPP